MAWTCILDWVQCRVMPWHDHYHWYTISDVWLNHNKLYKKCTIYTWLPYNSKYI